jgi:hypothetical protein
MKMAELLQLLPSLTLEQLLFVAQRDRLPVSSQILPCLIQADLEKAIHERNPELPIVLFRDDTQWGPLLAKEVGVNPARVTSESARNFGIRNNLPIQFLALDDPSTRLAIIGAVLTERNLPVPRDFWFPKGVNPLWMSLENFREVYSPYSDETPDIYLRHHKYQFSSSFEGVLSYQPMNILPSLAESIPAPNGDLYLKTQKGYLSYLLKQSQNEENRRFLIQTLDRKWINAYPKRREYLLSAASKLQDYEARSIFNIPIRYVLAIPPSRLEKEYLELLRSMGIRALGQMGVIYKTDPVMFNEGPALSHLEFLEPNLDLTREQLVQIVEANSIQYERFSQAAVEKVVGLLITNPSDTKTDFYRRLRSFHVPRFDILADPELCPNQETLLGEPVNELELTLMFGTLRSFRCYSPAELENAFIVDPSRLYAEFRKPENPRESFTRDQIVKFESMLRGANLHDYPEFRQAVQPLIEKMSLGLNILFRNGMQVGAERLRMIPERDLVERFFQRMFEAGMTQRRWLGPGNPYPMKYAETRGGCQADIEAGMTPILNDLLDILNSLSPESRAILENLPIVDYVSGLFGTRDMNIRTFLENIRNAEFCIAFGSSWMITTAAFYLSALDKTIPGFDIRQFEIESTHR